MPKNEMQKRCFRFIGYFCKLNNVIDKMANDFFQFKKFTVWHDQCAMKVGTDGVLLGAWVAVDGAKRLLDIGTGTGLVALMLAQRSSPEARITAIEIDPHAADQANENVSRSPWAHRIDVKRQDIKSYVAAEKYDTIVSNPPYYKNALRCPDEQRSAARHDECLTYEQLLQAVSMLLEAKGEFTVVIPMDVAEEFQAAAARYALCPIRLLRIATKPGASPKRILITFAFESAHLGSLEEKELLVEKSRHCYSSEYIALTRDFYLKME